MVSSWCHSGVILVSLMFHSGIILVSFGCPPGIILIHPSIRSFIKNRLISHFIDSVEIKRGGKKPPHEYVETDYEEVKD